MSDFTFARPKEHGAALPDQVGCQGAACSLLRRKRKAVL